MAKAPVYTMTVTLSDKEMTSIAVAAASYMDDNYNDSTFKLAGIDYKQLVSDVKADPKFQTTLVKAVQLIVSDAASCDLREMMFDNPELPFVKKARIALDKALVKEEKDAEAEYEQTLLAGAIKRLEDAGYTVSK